MPVAVPRRARLIHTGPPPENVRVGANTCTVVATPGVFWVAVTCEGSPTLVHDAPPLVEYAAYA